MQTLSLGQPQKETKSFETSLLGGKGRNENLYREPGGCGLCHAQKKPSIRRYKIKMINKAELGGIMKGRGVCGGFLGVSRVRASLLVFSCRPVAEDTRAKRDSLGGILFFLGR